MVDNIGISFIPIELDQLFEKFDFDDIVQAPMNIFDRSLEETGWSETLAQKKKNTCSFGFSAGSSAAISSP